MGCDPSSGRRTVEDYVLVSVADAVQGGSSSRSCDSSSEKASVADTCVGHRRCRLFKCGKALPWQVSESSSLTSVSRARDLRIVARRLKSRYKSVIRAVPLFWVLQTRAPIPVVERTHKLRDVAPKTLPHLSSVGFLFRRRSSYWTCPVLKEKGGFGRLGALPALPWWLGVLTRFYKVACRRCTTSGLPT